MIPWTQIRQTLVTWVKENAINEDEEALPNGQVIWEDQSDQRPAGEYASLKLISGPKRVGYDTTTNSTPDFIVSGLREFTLSVNLYRDKALERVSALTSGLHNPLIIEAFRAIGLAHIGESDVRDLTRPVGSRYEKRFQFDVMFRIADNIAVNPGVIEEVNAEGTVGGSIGPDINIELSVIKPEEA